MLSGATATQYVERNGLEALLKSGLITNWSTAIDGGAHVGTWSELLREKFETVHAFEPGPAFENLERNARDWFNVICRQVALADEQCSVESWHRKRMAKLTARKIRKVEGGGLQGIPIDDLALESCGLLKLDVEGFEYPALIGARKTIKRCKPFILVELAGHGEHIGKSDADVVALLDRFNYESVWRYNVDHGFVPKRGFL